MDTGSERRDLTTLAFERSEWGLLQASGPDRVKWLQGLITCDVASLQTGQGRWGLLLTRTGKIVSELIVVAAVDRLWIAAPARARQSVLEGLDGMLIMEDAELRDVSTEYASISVHGPGAGDLVLGLPPELTVARGGVEWLGAGDHWLIVPREGLPDARSRVAREAQFGDAERWRSLRLEYATPEWGTDFGSDDNPHQAALDQRCVAWSKGCYLGQEVVFMQGMRGKVRRRLTSLVLDTLLPCDPGSPVTEPETGVALGAITSSAVSPSLATVVALAMLSGARAPGQRVTCAGTTATVVERPV